MLLPHLTLKYMQADLRTFMILVFLLRAQIIGLPCQNLDKILKTATLFSANQRHLAKLAAA